MPRYASVIRHLKNQIWMRNWLCQGDIVKTDSRNVIIMLSFWKYECYDNLYSSWITFDFLQDCGISLRCGCHRCDYHDCLGEPRKSHLARWFGYIWAFPLCFLNKSIKGNKKLIYFLSLFLKLSIFDRLMLLQITEYALYIYACRSISSEWYHKPVFNINCQSGYKTKLPLNQLSALFS